MKFLVSLVLMNLLAFSAQAALTIECANSKTHLVLEFAGQDHSTATVQLEDKEGYIATGVETLEFNYDAFASRKGGAVFSANNYDYLIELKLPKAILTKVPQQIFKAELTPYFEGLSPRPRDPLTCKVKSL